MINNNNNNNNNNIHEFGNLINEFPDIKLSYDKFFHNKVNFNNNNIYIIIPKGYKIFIWFTYKLNKNICYLLYLDKFNEIFYIEETVLSYKKELSYNTILYGTLIKINNLKFVTIEDIFYYQNEKIEHKNKKYIERLKIIENILENMIKKVILTNKSVIFSFPIITEFYEDALNHISNLIYPVFGIKFYEKSNNYSSGIIINKINKIKECYFKIKCEISEDCYSLYCLDGIYNNALILDFKTSKLMNSIFRTIKENINLDLLEMSDEEEEFEINQPDKYIKNKDFILMKCLFNSKFKKWIPIEVCKKNIKLLTIKEVKLIEKS